MFKSKRSIILVGVLLVGVLISYCREILARVKCFPRGPKDNWA